MSFWYDVAEQRMKVALSLVDEVIQLKQSHDKLLDACKAYQNAVRLLSESNPAIEIALGSALALNQAEQLGLAAIAEAEVK